MNGKKAGSVSGISGIYHDNYTDFVIGMDNQGIGKYEEFCIDDLYFYEALVTERELEDYLSHLSKQEDEIGKFANFWYWYGQFILIIILDGNNNNRFALVLIHT